MSAVPGSVDQAILAAPVVKPESAVIAVAPANDTVTLIPVAAASQAAVASANQATNVIPVAPAAAAGLTVVAEARWPESEHDDTPPALPGFIVSAFSPIAAETAARCLRRRSTGTAGDAATRTAIIIASSRGDLQSATHVAAAVDTRAPLGPLLFFQSVPNAVAGHIAARWNLTGPVVCLADRASALDAADLLITDGDAEEALVIHIEQTSDTHAHDQAHAVLLRPAPRGERA